MKKIALILSAILLVVNSFAQNKVKVACLKDESSITYSMNHPLHAWTGESKEINSIILTDEAKNVIYQVAVSAKISSFDSKNANRDSHMMEVTEALKYTNVTFTSSDIKVDACGFQSVGTINFHGINQPVVIDGKLVKEGNKLIFSGEFKLKMSQFKIDPPSLMGISTDDEFKLSFKVVYQ
jgi:polyisoprenoid-binding protein YceI